MLYRLGVIRGGNRVWFLLCSLLEPITNEPEIRREILDSEGLDGRLGIRRDDVKHLWDRLLNDAEEFGVERELEDSAAPGFFRELGVDDFI